MAENAIIAAILPQNHCFSVIQDILKRHRPQTAEVVMPGQLVPQDRGAGDTAEEPGQGARGTQGGLFLGDDFLDDGHIGGRNVWNRRTGNPPGFAAGMEAAAAGAAGLGEFFAKIPDQPFCEAPGISREINHLLQSLAVTRLTIGKESLQAGHHTLNLYPGLPTLIQLLDPAGLKGNLTRRSQLLQRLDNPLPPDPGRLHRIRDGQSQAIPFLIAAGE